MRFLQIIRSIDRRSGGPADGVRQIRQALKSLSIESDVLACGGTNDMEPRAGVFIFGSGLYGFGFSPKALLWLFFNSHKYDRFIIHGPWQSPTFMALIALATRNKPYHIFSHGALEQRIAELFPIKHFKKLLYWVCVEQFAFAFSRSILFLSDEEIRNNSPFFKIKVRKDVVQYGIEGYKAGNLGSVKKYCTARPLAPRRLLYLGRLDKKKGCDILIDAFILSAQRHGYQLVFCGPDEYGFQSQSVAKYGSNPDFGRVQFLGFVDESEKWSLLLGCEAFVLSSYRENFGQAVAEALSCGTPVIISKGVGISPIVSQYKAGYVLDLNAEIFADAFVEFWNLNQLELESLKHASRRCFQECLSLDVFVASLKLALFQPKPVETGRD
jgi:glycosyltransferase involved in cell wall biosynthesis